MILTVLALMWAFGWGWWSQGEDWVGWCASAFWPVLVPTGRLYHWWRWGTKRNRRFVYTDTRWWQRGDRTKRPLR